MADQDVDPRRGFLKAIVGGSAAVLGALAAIPGLGFLLHPLRAKVATAGPEPIRVLAVPAELKVGKPVRVDVISNISDGWARLEKVKLGAAWLVRGPENRVHAYSTVCPHLGCGIDWDEKTEKFVCPCHQSGFGTDGQCLYGPSPRGLDELDVVATDSEIRVRYQRFKVATKSKEPV
ncbi:MAG TPA: Rieske (2Fe-2S) protein [Polyangia bacterium]|jgi:Rieske Fe-S protein